MFRSGPPTPSHSLPACEIRMGILSEIPVPCHVCVFQVPFQNVVSDPSEVGAVDVIIVATKSYDLREAAKAMRPLLGPATVVIPTLNGLEVGAKPYIYHAQMHMRMRE